MLTRDTILACSNDTSFRRGEKYYQQGRVQRFQAKGSHCSAVVIGTDEYVVELDTTSLEGDCNCYAYDGEKWCKHLVAVGLAAAEGEVKVAETPKVKARPGTSPKHEGLEKLLDKSSEPALRAALQSVIDRFPETYEFVEHVLNPPSLDSDKAIMEAVRACLKPVKQARSWERMVEAALLAEEEISNIARDAPSSESSVRGLLAAAQYVYKQLEQIDDSDGTLQAACGALCERAIEIVNEALELEKLLYETLARPSDLPLSSSILEEADKAVRERFVIRLEKHLYKRDPELASLEQDSASYLLSEYFARNGDKRLLDFLAEHAVHENIRRGLLVRYHEARAEWPELVKLLWTERETYGFRQLLRRALVETGDRNKLITLQIEDTLHTTDVERAILKLRHLLEQYGQPDKLPDVIDRILNSPRLPLGQRLWLLMDQRRYPEVASTMLEVLRKDTAERTRSPWNSGPYAVVDAVAEQNRRLQTVDEPLAVTIWKELFKLEADRVLKASNYDHFELFGNELIRLGEAKTVRELAAIIAEGYPTRKKLVTICNSWLDKK